MLYSRTGASVADRDAYVRKLVDEIVLDGTLKTVYFGGGSPALCDLSVLKTVLRPLCDEKTEFTVELHPLDATEVKLRELKDLGVNRISMGLQSFDDATLASMGRGYTLAEAERAFGRIKHFFDNAGIDLIVGYPGDGVNMEEAGGCWKDGLSRFVDLGLRHCSVYSLQNDRGLENAPNDDWVLDRVRLVAACLGRFGLRRYEISNYAIPGFECRHNLAVWCGEDYLGLGEGACGRIGRKRTKFGKEEVVSAEFDEKERKLFQLRTSYGLETAGHPGWGQILQKYVKARLMVRSGSIYRLTERGTEVCDSILADLV